LDGAEMTGLLQSAGRLYLYQGDSWRTLGEDLTLDALLSRPLAEIRELFGRPWPQAGAERPTPQALIQSQEVWAAGVTYERSLEARSAEAADADPYERIYTATRPEIFFKATAGRVRGPDQPVAIRSDSSWDVPEPELAVVCNSRMEIVGYTIGDDVSSRSIEGENPLYLPQAKVYDGCCSVGPVMVPAWEFDPTDRRIELAVSRDGNQVFRGHTSTSAMRRSVEELVAYTFRHQRFDSGCVLLTGTGIVPPGEFTLQPGDEIAIAIEGIGELRNGVERLSAEVAT
jgi:2-dehydro-3-deoxy-D-arabinonate dehydratase